MSTTTKYTYPTTRRDEASQNKQGLADPYQWLEDPDSEETTKWVEEQNKITLDLIKSWPHRDKLQERLTQIYDYPKYSSPMKKGDYYYFFKNDGLQNQAVMYQQKSLADEPRVFLDPNKLSEDGTVALVFYNFSESGKLFAYSVSKSGSDWKTVYVMNVETLEKYTDTLEWVKFSRFTWTHDDLGFFYTRYDQPKKVDSIESGKAGTEVDKSTGMKICHHTLGTSQQDDVLIYERPENAELIFNSEITDDGKTLILYTKKGTNHENYVDYADLSNFQQTKKLSFTRLVDNLEANYRYITNEGNTFYFSTTNKAAKRRVITIDLTNSAEENWKELIPETKNVLEDAICVNYKYLLLVYNEDVHNTLYLHGLDGKLVKEVTLPSLGTISVSGERKNTEFFYTLSSFVNPSTIYRYNVDTNESTLFRQSEIKDFNSEDFETKQVFYSSKDGTKVPMYIISLKGVVQDGNRPTILYGYGGFNISIMPSFNPFNVVAIKNLGFNFAVANIRGGAEYGEEWHKAGMREKKQNVFDDFIAAAEYLIDNKYTNPKKLAIRGGSNGGLLVTACMNQRPELFGCVIGQVGVLDMLKFHTFTIGHYWKVEYGDPDNAEDFKFISKYSPVHNVTKGKEYPATLLTTADHDDRVVPLHSYKYLATLQHELGNESYQTNPLMIRIETKAGHGLGKPTSKIIEEFVDMYSFAAKVFGIEWN